MAGNCRPGALIAARRIRRPEDAPPILFREDAETICRMHPPKPNVMTTDRKNALLLQQTVR